MAKHYPKEIRLTALKRYFKGKQTAAQIGRALKVPHQTISAWIGNAKDGLDSMKWTPRKIHDLCEKVKRLENMITVLKLVNCTTYSPIQEKLLALEPLYGRFPNHVLCDALDVPRGTFLNHIKRNKKKGKAVFARRMMLKERISQIHDDAKQRFGAGKIAAKLKEEGIQVSKEMVHELMLEQGLFSIRTISKSLRSKDLAKMRNVVMRNFNETAPNKTWVSDVTEFHYKNVSIFICVIIDLYARKVIGCKFSHSNSTHLIKMTFRQAYESRHPADGLVFHSDRGSNYKSRTMRIMLKSLGVVQSFSRSHTPYDNSVAEAFFKSLKEEELYRSTYRSEAELKGCVTKYIDFFNNERPHKAIDYAIPSRKEATFFAREKKQG